MTEIVKSVSDNQIEILRGILQLHCPEGFQCDATYGNGVFWKTLPKPEFKFDIDPQVEDVVQASSTCLPLPDAHLSNMVFDPPFLTYIKSGRLHNRKTMIMANRFSGYWKYSELEEHYKATLKEAKRVLAPRGKLIFKCQDIIHNHKLHCTHVNVINWAQELNFRLVDLFVLTAKNRMPTNRNGKQQHARVYHSYFLVFINASSH